MKSKLDKEEQKIERAAGSYRRVPGQELHRIEGLLEKIRKTKNVNIRISERVLAELKKRSLEDGIPYQTLISSVLHKFVTDQLVDEKAIRKFLQFLSPARY